MTAVCVVIIVYTVYIDVEYRLDGVIYFSSSGVAIYKCVR